MTKIVYNACHGGFGLSDAAVRRYAEIKGLTVYPEPSKYSAIVPATYWLVPEGERVKELEGDAWFAASLEERQRHNQAYANQTLSLRDVERDDLVLVQVVEELGDAASDRFAKLRIADVPSGSLYRIDEYDGFESVETPDSYEWKTAK